MTDKSSSAKFHICILSRRHYSSSKGRLGIFQRANERYEKFLERRFPRLYILYTTFVKGFWLMVHDVRETRKIRMNMLTQDVSLKDLPYREMETIILFHKDLIKAIPLVIISIPPFAIILVFTLMCLFPRQLLIHHLWTPQQQQDFQRLYHEQRCRHRENILKGVAWSIAHIKEWTLRSHLLTLISKRGAHPSVKDINAVRCMFSGQPLGISGMASGHMACYLWRLNPSSLTTSQCREWLLQWLQLSTHLTESETSLLLHNMVLLSMTTPAPDQRKKACSCNQTICYIYSFALTTNSNGTETINLIFFGQRGIELYKLFNC